MADEPDFTEITVRHKDGFYADRQIAKRNLPFWPNWERVDSQDRKVSTPTTSKDA